MTRETVAIEALTRQVGDILIHAGICAGQALPMADVMVAGERDGCKSHGLYRIAGCLRTLKAGKADGAALPVLSDAGQAVIRVNAGGGFSPAAFALGAPVLAERARALGLAALVINDCIHFSALWPEVEVLTGQGLAALALCPSSSTVAPAGGLEKLLGTNPIAFGWPRRDAPPYVFDFATSVAARGEVELHLRAGDALPQGWALDAGGQPTTDPATALQGAMLPFGGHKGSAISTMIELLAGAMIGDLISPESTAFLADDTLLPRHGELILAFDPARFSAGRAGDPLDRAETLFAAILGQGARLPSQRRFAARETALRDGIRLSAAELAALADYRARGLGAV